MTTTKNVLLVGMLMATSCFTASAGAQTMRPEAEKKLAHDIYKEFIEIQSGYTTGATTPVVQAAVRYLKAAGFSDSDIFVGGASDKKANLVVRLRGTGAKKPILLLAHTDVVEAKREDWTTDPFQFIEKDGFYYGRGTGDDKDGDAIMSATLIRMKKEGYVPSRDIILAMTADEEGGTSNGVDWLIKNHRELIDAEFVLNHDGGGVLADQGKPLMMEVNATEKLYGDFVRSE